MDKSADSIDATTPQDNAATVPDSPKPLAFTIQFEDGKVVDNKRHKLLVERYQNRHRRGQSLTKLDDSTTCTSPSPRKHPLSGKLPRKSSFHSEGYFSSDEKLDGKRNVLSAGRTRTDLTLPLRNLNGDPMSQSFPNGIVQLTPIKSPELELKDVSSPEMDLVSPYSPRDRQVLPSQCATAQRAPPVPNERKSKVLRQYSSPECELKGEDAFVDGGAFDFDQSDTVSDAGTYTLETDNYTEEQKARMSIDREFNIEQVSVMRKTEEYIQSLNKPPKPVPRARTAKSHSQNVQSLQDLHINATTHAHSPITNNHHATSGLHHQNGATSLRNSSYEQKLSPILSPTQNISITDTIIEGHSNVKTLFPTVRARTGIGVDVDQGCFTSITSSGAFRKKLDVDVGHHRQPSLTKSEIQVQTYTDAAAASASHCAAPVTSGKDSPTKIPSPIHAVRPRSGHSSSSLNVDCSDSSLETESYLKSTQNYINALQKRLSAESDPDSDYDSSKYRQRLNNEGTDLLKQRPMHVRHNSFDDTKLQTYNKLEHFQTKNLQGIDQTFNKLNQYALGQHRSIQKIQNSPNNSPIKRSCSFSAKNAGADGGGVKVSNLNAKNTNVRNSPHLERGDRMQRSASTANMNPNCVQLRQSNINLECGKIDRSQFGDTESSSEEDFDKHLMKKKDFSNITNTRYNRAFSLRRARLDSEPLPPKCPNTPEMRRKFQPLDHLRAERAISVDRRPLKSNDVQSRYLQNVTKQRHFAEAPKPTKSTPTGKATNKPQVFSRTDTGRFSMRTKPPITNAQKVLKKEVEGKGKSGTRSNSSLTSKEMEFQNWKRRKSYDPMKAAAEGKKRAELAKRLNQNTTQLCEGQTQDCDSSPSHSSSVHRSQSFHGTAALEQLISSEEDDLTLSADEGFSPPTPSPCNLSPARAKLRSAWKNKLLL